MKTLRFSLHLLIVALVVLAFSSVASAQATRTWVSGVGDDVNPCSRTAPCKTFAGAISKTAGGGEIDCLDPGGFGALTITKSITIDCDSGAGGVLSSGGPGITVAAQPTDIIILRNLTISGAGTTLGTNGINVITAKLVGLEDVVINYYSNACLNVSSSTTAVVYADDSKFINCPTAIAAGNNSKITVTRSLIAGAPTAGISQSGASVVMISGSTVTNTGTAFLSAGGSVIGVSGCTLTYNTLVYNTNGGAILTGTDNPSFGNTGTGSVTAGGVPKT